VFIQKAEIQQGFGCGEKSVLWKEDEGPTKNTTILYLMTLKPSKLWETYF
jgi:hypothetical protein